MNKIFNKFQEKILPLLIKVGQNKYLIALRNGIAFVMPLTIIGSIFNIIAYFPVPGWENILGDFKPILEIPATASMGILAIVTVVGVAYALSEQLEVKPVATAFIALVTFIVTQTTPEWVIDTTNFGTKGMFLGIVVSIVTVKIVEYFMKRGMTIKLPAGVPPMVASSFEVLVPGFVVVTLFWGITKVAGFDLINFINIVLSPLVKGIDTLPGLMILVFFTCLLWCCGINGDSVFGGVVDPIMMTLFAANSAAFVAGETIPNITAYGLYYFGMWFGGTGATIGLVLLMVRSKSRTYKSLGDLCIAPGIFCINEPVTYGFPIVFNPIMMIPYILTPMISVGLTYILMYFNVIGRVVAMIPWTTPPVLSGFLCTGGDWRAALWQIVLIFISVCIYYPFFKIAEKRQIEEERVSIEIIKEA